MSLLQQIHSGRRHAPPRLMIYGTEGIGKSTTASQAPKPIFIPTEDGLDQIDCDSFPLARRFDEVAALVEGAGLALLRRSALRKAPPPENFTPEVVLVDTMGELVDLYSLADIVFVGGSLVPFGGHNLMDPAGLGKPVLTGPHTWNFAESVSALREAGGLVEVEDAEGLRMAVERLLADPASAAEQGRRARQAILRRRGAAQRTLELIQPILRRAETGKTGR